MMHPPIFPCWQNSSRSTHTTLHCSLHAIAINYRHNFWALLEVRKKTYIYLKSGAVLKSGRNTIRDLSDNQGWRLRINVFVHVINDVFVKVSIWLDSSCLIFKLPPKYLCKKKKMAIWPLLLLEPASLAAAEGKIKQDQSLSRHESTLVHWKFLDAL